MVGEHCETEKFTTTMQERGHECRWTRPRREGEQGRESLYLLAFCALFTQKKSLRVFALAAQLERAKVLVPGTMGASGLLSRQSFSL